jgi:choline transport protein
MACMLTVSIVALNAVHQTASRLTWSFARDEALFYSNKLAAVNPTLGVPIWATLLDGLCVLLVGIIYVASSNGIFVCLTFPSIHHSRRSRSDANVLPCTLKTAFNAFIGTTVILAQISYAIPAALLLYRRRSTDYLPSSRPFKLPSAVGYIVNTMTIVWAVVLTVFFTFPTVLPATGENMSMYIFRWLWFLLPSSLFPLSFAYCILAYIVIRY